MDLIVVIIALAALVLLSAGSNVVLWLALRSSKDLSSQLTDSLDKAMGMIRASDPWQYQTIRALDEPVQYADSHDQSPISEYERKQEEELNGLERDALSDIIGL